MRTRAVRRSPWQGADRRAYRRIEADLPAQIWLDGRHFTTRISDISLGGTMVDGTFEAHNGSSIEVELEGLPRLSGQVVHAASTFLGVEFSISPEVRQILSQWIEQRLMQRP